MNDVIVSNPQLEPIINLDNALRIRIYILFTSVLCIFRNRYSGYTYKSSSNNFSYFVSISFLEPSLLVSI